MPVHVERQLLINYKLHASIRVGSLSEFECNTKGCIFSIRGEKYLEEFETRGIKIKTVIRVGKKNMEGIIAAHMRNVNMTTGNKEFKKFRFFLAAYFLKCTEGDLES